MTKKLSVQEKKERATKRIEERWMAQMTPAQKRAFLKGHPATLTGVKPSKKARAAAAAERRWDKENERRYGYDNGKYSVAGCINVSGAKAIDDHVRWVESAPSGYATY